MEYHVQHKLTFSIKITKINKALVDILLDCKVGTRKRKEWIFQLSEMHHFLKT